MFKKVQKAAFTAMMWFAIVLAACCVGFMYYLFTLQLLNMWVKKPYAFYLVEQVLVTLLIVVVAVFAAMLVVNFAATMKVEIDDF